jgi:hypothetical protein
LGVKVIDKLLSPVVGVRVYVSSSGGSVKPAVTYTDSNGEAYAVFWSDSVGNYTVMFSSSGIDSVVYNIHVYSGTGGGEGNASSSENLCPIGWKYYRPVNVVYTGTSPLIDYQVKINLDSSNFNFDHAKDDGSDILFMDDNNTILPHWIEYWNKTEKRAIIWVKIPKIETGTTIVYMFYGNPNAPSGYRGNGENVFEFFDDFNGFNTSKWDITRYRGDTSLEGVVEEGYMKLVKQSMWRGCNIKAKDYRIKWNNRCVIEFKFYINYYCKAPCNDGDGLALVIDGKDTSASDGCNKGFGNPQQGIVVEIINDGKGGSSNDVGIQIDDDTAACRFPDDRAYKSRLPVPDKLDDLQSGIISVILTGSQIIVHYQDLNPANGYFSGTISANVWNPHGKGYLMIGAGTGCSCCSTTGNSCGGSCSCEDSGHWIDWIRVRKYADPEPNVVVGEEQTCS